MLTQQGVQLIGISGIYGRNLPSTCLSVGSRHETKYNYVYVKHRSFNNTGFDTQRLKLRSGSMLWLNLRVQLTTYFLFTVIIGTNLSLTCGILATTIILVPKLLS